jgi:two-component system, cell cycle response regulator CtrA
MLELMATRQGSTFTKEMFLNAMYGGIDEPEIKIINVFMCRLRKKLAEASGGKNYVETVWGRGYALRPPEEGPSATESRCGLSKSCGATPFGGQVVRGACWRQARSSPG